MLRSEIVWTQQKQMAVIDSIWSNLYVPPVLFNVTKDDKTGDDIRVCIDGKQVCPQYHVSRVKTYCPRSSDLLPFQDSWSGK